jgi:hypothetical protein
MVGAAGAQLFSAYSEEQMAGGILDFMQSVSFRQIRISKSCMNTNYFKIMPTRLKNLEKERCWTVIYIKCCKFGVSNYKQIGIIFIKTKRLLNIQNTWQLCVANTTSRTWTMVRPC